jgi:CBS domain-containing membrane protein
VDTKRARAWLQGFSPPALAASAREIVLGCVGAGLGLLGTERFSAWVLGTAHPWFIAPMGASALLLFAVPASPLAQPWPLLGGNVVAALVGVACAHIWGHGALAIAAAVSLAITAMFMLRCLHPPAGAVAVTAVIGGPSIGALDYAYALWPVGVNSLFLLVLALAFNNLTRRRYPHQPAAQAHPHRTTDPLPSARLGFTQADLRAALASQGVLLDISPGDLEQILMRAQLAASRRRFAQVRCADIMSRDVVSVAPRDTVDTAWERLQRHRIKAMPVIEPESQRLVGIVSLHDFFLAQTAPDPRHLPVLAHARHVQDIMTREVRTARPEQSLADLVGLFSDGGLHHMPVVNAQHQVVGMITQSDVVAALFKTGARAEHSTAGP